MIRLGTVLVVLSVFCALSGCVRAISKEVRKEAAHLEGFGQLRQEPASFQGQTVILGGDVLETRNRPEGTTLVILEKPLDWALMPRPIDVSGGRFLVRFGQYLDPAVYARGRRVTVAGRVAGTESEMVGEAPYTYVVLEGREAYLWRESYDTAPPWWDRDTVYPYPWWYDPYWGARPWR